MTALLVGLDNPHSRNPRHALLPTPEGAAGDRIVQIIRERWPDYSAKDYLSDFFRIDLYPGGRAATGRGATRTDRRMAAWCVLYARAIGASDLVMLGQRVIAAFAYVSDQEWRGLVYHGLPHPSGRSRHLNDRRERLEFADRLLELRT